MKTTTITREYDDQGRMIRETVVTDDRGSRYTGMYPSAQCTCTAWFGVVPPPPCPVHGQSRFVRITCSPDTSPARAAVKALRDAEFLHG